MHFVVEFYQGKRNGTKMCPFKKMKENKKTTREKRPSGGEDANGGGVGVVLSRSDGRYDGIFGNWSGAEAGESGGITVAERDGGPRVSSVEVGHDRAEDSTDAELSRAIEYGVWLEIPAARRSSVLHLLFYFYSICTLLSQYIVFFFFFPSLCGVWFWVCYVLLRR